MRALSLAFLVCSAAPLLAQKDFGFDNRKGSGQPYLSPEETVKRFKVAPEFEVKLFAGEPQVVNPIAFTIDEKGRVWVVESFEYPKRTPKGKAPRDRIIILEDTDGDGVCDKRTVFAEGKDFPVPPERAKAGLGAFDMASGIEVGHGGVYVGAPPYLWFIENKNDKPGKIETLLKGFGSEDTHETLNTFQWGPDGWLYGLHGIFTHSTVKSTTGDDAGIKMNAAVWRLHPRTKKFELFAEGTSNPWGMDWRNTDGQFILACCVIPHLFHMVPGGVYKRQAGTNFNPYAYGQINEICDHTFHRESGWAHAGLISLDVPHMPEKYRNSVIFGSIHGCSLKQNILKPNGSTYTASRGDDFLQSGDKNVRPINLRWGPNGDIYMIDWHDQNPCHQTKPDDWDYERGRVYRIQLKGTKTKVADDLGKKTPVELLSLLQSENPYVYRGALRVLYESDKQVDPQIMEANSAEIAKIPAVRRFWMMRAAGWVFPTQVNNSFATPGLDPWWIRTFTDPELISDKTAGFFTKLATITDNSTVRRELASAAIRLADTHDVRPLIHALLSRKEDAKDPLIPFLTWLAYEKVLASGERKLPGENKQGANAPRSPVADELAFLAKNAAGNAFVTDQIIPRVMRRLVATGNPDDLALCLKFAAEVPDLTAKRQALTGLSEAFKGRSVKPPTEWKDVRTALAKLDDKGVHDQLNRLAVSFHDPAAIKRALSVLRDAKTSTDERIEAVRELAELRPEEAATLFRDLAGNGDNPVSLRVEAVRGLIGFARTETPKDVLANWKTYPPQVRAEAVTLLASRKDWAKSLLLAMQAGTVERSTVTDNVIVRIEAFEDKELNGLILKAWGRSRPTPKELDAQIAKLRGDLATAPGSFARGKVVFENNCGKCHKFEGRGNEVGPPLDGAARDIEYILANVIDPNRVIGAPYFQRIVKTIDGRVEQGLLHAEDEQTITLKVENAVLKRIAKADLDGPVQVVEKSMMPEGLTAGMTPQNVRDLVRYVMAHPFVTTATMNGKPVNVGVPGRIPLPEIVGEIVIAAAFTASDVLKTQLLFGATGAFTVKLDGKTIGSGTGDDRRARVDQFSFPVELSKGSHTLTIVLQHKGSGDAVYARFLDPDRKLTHPEAYGK